MDRRDEILSRISSRTSITDTGFQIDGKPSPCFLWTGPTSGTGRGGGYGRMSLNGHTVAVHLVAYTHFYGYIPGNSVSTPLLQHGGLKKKEAKKVSFQKTLSLAA